MAERFRERMRRERADLIVAHATTMLAEQGCCHVRVEDVAKRAGVAKGTVYLDFESKEELVEAALRRCGDEIIQEMSVQSRGAPDAHARLRAAIDYLVRLRAERPDLAPLMERRLLCGRTDGEVMPAHAVARHLRGLIDEAKGDGGIRSDIDSELAAQAAVALAQVPAWLDADNGPARAADTVERMLSTL